MYFIPYKTANHDGFGHYSSETCGEILRSIWASSTNLTEIRSKSTVSFHVCLLALYFLLFWPFGPETLGLKTGFFLGPDILTSATFVLWSVSVTWDYSFRAVPAYSQLIS